MAFLGSEGGSLSSSLGKANSLATVAPMASAMLSPNGSDRMLLGAGMMVILCHGQCMDGGHWIEKTRVVEQKWGNMGGNDHV